MGMRGKVFSGVAAAALALTACTATEDSAEPAPLIRDSAGVMILETAATEQLSASWTLGEPTVRIGQREGEVEYLLDRVRGALLLEGGRIAVANGGSNEIRIYDRDGRFLSARGGEGEGPGEFEYMRAMDRCAPEGFVAFDLHDDRLFAGTGEHFEVQVWTLDGELERILRGPAVDLTVTDSLRSAYADGRLAETPPERHPALRRELGDMPPVEARTAFTALRVDEEGVVWLENLSVAAGEPQRWSLMDPERGYLGDLTLPGGHELLEAGARYVLTLSGDELGVERVVLFPLERGEASDQPFG